MGLQRPCDDGNELIRELLSSDNIALINAVGLGEVMKDRMPLVKRPRPRPIRTPTRALEPPLRRIEVCGVADSGKACNVAGYKFRIVHDLETLQVSPGPIPIKYAHYGMRCGFVETFNIRARGGMAFRAALTYEYAGCLTDQIRRRALDGEPFQCSLATKCECFQYLGANEWFDINGICVCGPLLIARGAKVTELSVTKDRCGADQGAYLCVEGTWEFARHSNGVMTAEELLDARLHHERGRVAYDDAVAAGRARAAAIRHEMRKDGHQARQAAIAQEWQERLDQNQSRADYIRTVDSSQLAVLAAASVARCQPGYRGW